MDQHVASAEARAFLWFPGEKGKTGLRLSTKRAGRYNKKG